MKQRNGLDVYAIGVDEAINLTKPYIPSFLEIYATYIATGEYDLPNAIYDYYIDESKYQLEVTLYQLTNITEEVRNNPRERMEYTCSVDGGEEIQLTQEEFDAEVAKAKKDGGGFFKWLLYKLDTFLEDVGTFLAELWNDIKEILGFNLTVNSDYIGVVTKGTAYDYYIEQQYDIEVEKMDTVRMGEESLSQDSSLSYEGEEEVWEYEKVDEKCWLEGSFPNYTRVCEDVYDWVEKDPIKHKYYLTAYTYLTYDYSIEQYISTLKYVSSSITEYKDLPEANGANNRFEHVFSEVVKANSLEYTTEDIALVQDVINSYCSTSYGLIGGVSNHEFVMAGDTNESVINFARQFTGKNLQYMMAQDDTGTFFSDHWCAMFVTYCMEKAGVPVSHFTSCSRFWSNCQTKPGFYDISSSCGAKNGGYITSDTNHIATYKDIQAGDIVLFRWDSAGAGKQRSHTGIVSKVEKDSSGEVVAITVIEGNMGGTSYNNSTVQENRYTKDNYLYNIVSFVSISQVIAENAAGNSW